MSFREKSAWISFICLLLLTVAYFVGLHHHPHDSAGHDVIGRPLLVFALFGAFIVLEVVLHIIVAAMAPREARTPRDERERLIELRAARAGFHALVAGEFLAMAFFHAHGRALTLLNTVLLAILIAWLVKLGTELTLYRRDS